MKLSSVILISITSLALMSSCGKKEDDTAAATTELEGIWTDTCTASSDASSYSKSTTVVTGTTETTTSNIYTDAACSTVRDTVVSTATFSLGAAVTAPSGAKEYNSKISKILWTVKNDQAAAYNYCGGGFTQDVAKELNATNCADDADLKSSFADSYDVYKLDGAKLYFGVTGDAGTDTDGTTAAKRPTTLKTTVWTKS
jgi:hypothetical protein